MLVHVSRCIVERLVHFSELQSSEQALECILRPEGGRGTCFVVSCVFSVGSFESEASSCCLKAQYSGARYGKCPARTRTCCETNGNVTHPAVRPS